LNYYERHIGDYLKDTAHLSLLEHGVYGRLLDVYYTRESPIPSDQAARLVGARSKEERVALDAVLAEFFVLEGDAYRQSRCDRDIAEFKDGEPDREAKKANEVNRNKIHRAERSRLFKLLTDAGGHAAWNIGMTELRALVKSVAGSLPAMPQGIDSNGFVPQPSPEYKTPATRPATLPATAPATPATATHTQTHTHTPVLKNQRAHVEHQQGGPDGPARADFESLKTEAGEAMRRAGIGDVSDTHPELLALLRQGMTVEELAAAAIASAAKGKGFAYALAKAAGKRQDAAAQAALPSAPPMAGSDPDSRPMIEADGLRLQVGAWRQVDSAGNTVTWPAYAAMVQAARKAERVAVLERGVSA
jgi:uncharacterized protein YdaU (DUF1376 family)